MAELVATRTADAVRDGSHRYHLCQLCRVGGILIYAARCIRDAT